MPVSPRDGRGMERKGFPPRDGGYRGARSLFLPVTAIGEPVLLYFV